MGYGDILAENAVMTSVFASTVLTAPRQMLKQLTMPIINGGELNPIIQKHLTAS
jgi:hypothetical protein